MVRSMAMNGLKILLRSTSYNLNYKMVDIFPNVFFFSAVFIFFGTTARTVGPGLGLGVPRVSVYYGVLSKKPSHNTGNTRRRHIFFAFSIQSIRYLVIVLHINGLHWRLDQKLDFGTVREISSTRPKNCLSWPLCVPTTGTAGVSQ